MSSIMATPAITAPQMTPIMAAFMGIEPGTYQNTEEKPPARAALHTRNFVMRDF